MIIQHSLQSMLPCSGKKVKSEKKYSHYKYPDDSEDVAVRHLFWN